MGELGVGVGGGCLEGNLIAPILPRTTAGPRWHWAHAWPAGCDSPAEPALPWIGAVPWSPTQGSMKRQAWEEPQSSSSFLPLSCRCGIKDQGPTNLHCVRVSQSVQFSSAHFSSVAQLCPTLCDPMDCSMPGFPVHHQLPEFTQTHVHWISDAIQPSHPLSIPSPPAFNLSQHQGLFKWVSSSHQVAKVLEFQLQHQSVQWTSRTDLL